jgi:alpha-glucuronidase
MLRKAGVLLVLLVPAIASAETGYDAWLRYVPLAESAQRIYRDAVPAVLVNFGVTAVAKSAGQELARGLHGFLGWDLETSLSLPPQGAIVLGTLAELRRADPRLAIVSSLQTDAYALKMIRAGDARYLVVAGDNERGVLYGVFALLRRVGLGEPIADLDEQATPSVPVRWINQWDNLDGTIERGYGGRSIFWTSGRARDDLSRVADYGRLLASVGINGITINNVNANPALLMPEAIPQVARIADAFRPWGIEVGLAIDFGSPQSVGKLATYDPLDPAVIAWWKTKTDEIYRAIPDFAGFVLKADSEGRVGPSTYGRTHAEAANVVARALQPHKGVIFYRGFVYDHHMDWQNPKNDRARAAYDNFHDLDGQFEDNVILQIKNGPIDFQVREPASPLFGAMPRTREAIELQITQEYLGQSRHMVFLVPMWKETLDFDMRVHDAPSPVKAIVEGHVTSRSGGFVGVANVGLDDTWSGSHLAQANLYGFGRLAWNPDLPATQLAEEWTRLTFGPDPVVVDTISRMQLGSWRTYENYTGPLGLQTLTDIVGNHFGVAVEASERNGWGQWHKADEQGVGFDRTVATGTGFTGQYQPDVAKLYESIDTCPDDLLLFMHHVPYAHTLHSGKTVIQSIYDSHYDGAAATADNVRDWTSLKGRIDDERYRSVLAQLDYQAGQAIVWRDAVSTWFLQASGIADASGRVGNYPGRIEAESARLSGYVVKPVTPWETASGGKAIECPAASCTAIFKYDGGSGQRDLTVRYFDVNNGAAKFKVYVADRLVGEWTADDRVLVRNDRVDGSSSSRRTFHDVRIAAGDEIRIEGMPDGRETAALDYIEIGDPVR